MCINVEYNQPNVLVFQTFTIVRIQLSELHTYLSV